MIDVNLLNDMSNRKSFSSGQVIIQDGDAECSDLYIILKGSVGIYKNFNEPEEIRIAVLPVGSFFGEMALFLNRSRTATAVAAEDTILLTIDRDNAYVFFKNQPEATFLLIKSLCSRVEVLTSFFAKPKIDNRDSLDIKTIQDDLPNEYKFC